MTAEKTLLIIAAMFYLAATVLYDGRWPLRGQRARRLGAIVLVCGIAWNASAVIVTSIGGHGWPLLELHQTFVLVGLAIPVVYLGVLGREPQGLGVISLPGAVLALVLAMLVPEAASDETYELGTLFHAHILVAIVAYAAFGLAFSCGASYLIKESLLKRKRFTGLAIRLPSLDSAEMLGYRLAGLGFVLWTLMIASGAIYTDQVAGEYWGWTPKQTWSLVTWLIYAAYLHARMVAHYRGRTTVAFLVAGFACACTTYLIANYLGDPYHL